VKPITVYTVPAEPKEIRTEFLREAKHKGVNFTAELGEYFIAEGTKPDLVWATDIAFKAYQVDIPSITLGAKSIRETVAGKTEWYMLEGTQHRRASLIADLLRVKSPTPISFLTPKEATPSGPHRAGFFLTSADKAIVLTDSVTPYPGGGIPLAEEKSGPPSRAYLKLWEAFARMSRTPQAGSRVLDLGSCPGGWTWVLAKLGCEILSIDGAPLEKHVADMQGVHFKKGDAFKLKPEEASAFFEGQRIDWVFSDMICEPARLVSLLETWLSSGLCENFVISVKFKGEADEAAIQALSRLGGGTLRHLRQNKHELTWIRLDPSLIRTSL